jgi:hypothetical protein
VAAIIRRITLAPAILTPLEKPAASDYLQVDISNAGTGTLFVYSGDTPIEDVDNFLKIAPGASRLLRFRSRSSAEVIVYLKTASGGEVVLVWG